MSHDTKGLQKKMQDALDTYKSDNSSVKPYITSMKEISSWLATKEK